MCCVYDPWCAVEGCTTLTGLATLSDGKIIGSPNLAIMNLGGAPSWYLLCHAPATPPCLQSMMNYPNHASVPGKYCNFHGGDRSKHLKPKPSEEDWTVDGEEALGKDGSDILGASERWFASLEKTMEKKESTLELRGKKIE